MPIERDRRSLLRGSLALAATGPGMSLALRAQAAPFPVRPITLLIPWPAGGSTDISMRVLAEIAAKEMRQSIVVENRSGAGGTMAMPLLLNAPADGYTIAQLPLTIYRMPHTTKVAWDPIRDVTPILQLSGVTFGIVVPTNSPFQNLDDLLAFARQHPKKLTVGSNGIGTTPHLVIEELFEKLGLSYIHVPYKGTAEQMFAVAGGHLMVGVNSTGFGPYVDTGKLRLLVTFGEQRTKRWPYAPTLKELGYPIVANSPYGLGGPKGMPAAVTRVLHDAFKIAMFHPAHIAEIQKYDQELAYLGTDDYARFTREAFQKERLWVEKMGLSRPN
jgi:tripartite-type tricarboxylate transporter receptor subunit TctC